MKTCYDVESYFVVLKCRVWFSNDKTLNLQPKSFLNPHGSHPYHLTSPQVWIQQEFALFFSNHLLEASKPIVLSLLQRIRQVLSIRVLESIIVVVQIGAQPRRNFCGKFLAMGLGSSLKGVAMIDYLKLKKSEERRLENHIIYILGWYMNEIAKIFYTIVTQVC